MKRANSYYQQGVHLQKKRQWEAARQAYQTCLEHEPTFYMAHHNLGTIYQHQHQWSNAESHFQQALKLNPRFHLSYYHLGLIYQAQGQFEPAKTMYQKCLKLNPGLAQAYYQLGILAEHQYQFKEAFQSYKSCLELNPSLIEIYLHLGRLAAYHQAFYPAVNYYLKAIRFQPKRHEIWIFLFETLQQLSDIDMVLECVKGLILHYPTRAPMASMQLAHYLEKQGESEAALACVRQTLEQHPPEEALWELKKELMIPSMPQNTTELAAAVESVAAALARYMVQEDLETRVAPLVVQHMYGFLMLFYGISCLAYYGINVYPFRQQASRLYQRLLVDLSAPVYAPNVLKHRPYRLGLLCGSGVVPIFCRGLLQHLDPEQISIKLWYTDQAMLLKFPPTSIENPTLTYDVLSFDAPQALKQLAQDQLDMVYFTEPCFSPMQNFLALFRLAPLQFTSWLTLGTTGHSHMDCYVSSELLEIPEADHFYTERLIRFKTLPVYFYRPNLTGTPMCRADFGLPEEGTMYACPQSVLKFHPDFDVWLQGILERDKTGFVVLVFTEAQRHRSDFVIQRFRRTFSHLMDRIWVLPGISEDMFLHLLAVADVMLDTPYVTGGSTSYQGFAVGTPIVTLPGRFIYNRFTTGFYRKMGIPGAIASSPADYIDLALRLGQDLDYREQMRQDILSHNHHLFEDAGAVTEYLAFFEQEMGRRL